MSASGRYENRRLAHRIVGTVDLRLGSRSRPVLEAHVAAAGERFRGVRMTTVYRKEGLFGGPSPAEPGMLRDPALREGAKVLAAMDLSLDVWCLHPQLEEVIEFADALPDLSIVLNHTGTPDTIDVGESRRSEVLAQWQSSLEELAHRPNVTIKLGGLGMDLSHSIGHRYRGAGSEQLAEAWKSYIEPAIAAFSPQRAMFESNFPPDNAAGSYGAVWNAFKRIAARYSDDEKDQLFRGTAARVYRIALD
jgi:predicted TIM-barrel fold metal-dependent hydrolase